MDMKRKEMRVLLRFHGMNSERQKEFSWAQIRFNPIRI